MVVYKIFFRFLCFKELELLKTVISDWNLLYLSQKDPEPNLKGFQYQICTSVKKLGKTSFCKLTALILG